MGGLDRRHCTRAGRHIPGALLNSTGSHRSRGSDPAGEFACAGAGACRRMAAAQREAIVASGRANREHPQCFDGGWNDRCVCHSVYRLRALWISSARAAFLLLGAVALATLAAALLHGPALAGLGIVGAYLAPMLVTSKEPDYWSLYVYIAVVNAAAFALARFRLWYGLALTALIFGALCARRHVPCCQSALRTAHGS